jgi:flagellar biosynthesis/type III secretory pathway chaperone
MADAVNRLIDTLQRELNYQRDLAAVLDNKLDAMRRYDMPRLEALSKNEQNLIESIRKNEMLRRQVIALTARQLYPGRVDVKPTAGEIAQAVAEPDRGKLIVLTGMLREVAEKVRRLNRVNAAATNKILGHFQQVFQIIAQSGKDIGL